MKKILMLVMLPLLGIGGGVGAGLALRTTPDAQAEASSCTPEQAQHADKAVAGPGDDHNYDGSGIDYVKLDNQFVIPLVKGGSMQGLVVMSLSLEVAGGIGDTVYMHEPKLRDRFLEVMFEHANIGGFDGEFTDTRTLDTLKASLRDAAQNVLGKGVTDVLITNIGRQD